VLPRPSTRRGSRTHAELANFTWSICNLLRGPYKRNEYRKVILPLTEPPRLHPRLLPQRARGHGALRLRRADRISSSGAPRPARRWTSSPTAATAWSRSRSSAPARSGASVGRHPRPV